MELRSEQGKSLPLPTNTGEEQQTEPRPCRESAQQSSTPAERRRPFRWLRAHVRLLRRRRNINADPKETTRILNSKTRNDGLATTSGNNDTNIMSPPTETEAAATTTNMAAVVSDVGTFTECNYFSSESQQITTNTDSETESDLQTTIPRSESTSSLDETETSSSSDSFYFSSDSWTARKMTGDCVTISENQSEDTNDNVPTTIGLTEATTGRDDMPTTVGQTEATTGTDDMPTSEGLTEATTGRDDMPTTVGLTEATTGTDDMPAAIVLTEATTGTDNMPPTVGQTGMPNMPTSEGAVLAPTSHEEPAEDKSHPSRTSGQPAQQSSTPAGTHSLLKRVRDFFRPLLCCCKNRRNDPESNKEETPERLTLKTFKYHQLLGKGCFGKVLLASHPNIDEPLAVKIADKKLMPVYRQLNECQAHKMVGGCRFFPQLYGTFQTKNYLCYIMEYESGGTLQQFIKNRKPLDMNTFRFIAAELLCGVQFLHSRGIIHNDIKSSNILMDNIGHVKIADFGISEIKLIPSCSDVQVCQRITNYQCSDYLCYHDVLVEMFSGRQLNNRNEDDIQLEDLMMTCFNRQKLARSGNLQQHPFFEGINWNELQAGRISPPYVMTSILHINRSSKIQQIDEDCDEESEVQEFDFVSDRWKDLKKHH